jgi:hypothetical protein
MQVTEDEVLTMHFYDQVSKIWFVSYSVQLAPLHMNRKDANIKSYHSRGSCVVFLKFLVLL